LLLHVVDGASPSHQEERAEVDRVLAEIGAEAVPQVLVWNKIDLLDPSRQPRIPQDTIEVAPGIQWPRVFVSAVTGTGLDTLRQVIARAVPQGGAQGLRAEARMHDSLHSDA
jgi:GTP-binding protein HflX